MIHKILLKFDERDNGRTCFQNFADGKPAGIYPKDQRCLSSYFRLSTKIGPSRRGKVIFAGQMFSTNGSAFLFFLCNCNKKVGYACNLSVPKVNETDYQ